jgi:hypothetical protein
MARFPVSVSRNSMLTDTSESTALTSIYAVCLPYGVSGPRDGVGDVYVWEEIRLEWSDDA